MTNSRLTDPAAREWYATYGHLNDISGASIEIVALPKKMVEDEQWILTLILSYFTALTFVMATPFMWSAWYQSTIDRLHPTTAHLFFKAATAKRELQLAELISLFSQCHELTTLVQSYEGQANFNQLRDLMQELPALRNNVKTAAIEVCYFLGWLIRGTSTCTDAAVCTYTKASPFLFV